MSISTVTSEALQLKLRELLPSQQGFSTDLSASDTIIPVIDLTAAAEGSTVAENLQTALAFGSNTAFNVAAVTTAIISTTGFFRIIGGAAIQPSAAGVRLVKFEATDGTTNTTLWEANVAINSNTSQVVIPFDFNVFVDTGITINAIAAGNCVASGSTRQIADINGTLVNPVGFTPQ